MGRHDFTQFANVGPDKGLPNNPIKHLQQCELVETTKGLRVDITASGFLYR